MKLTRSCCLVLVSLFLVFNASHAIAQDAPPKGFGSIELLWPGGAPGAVGKAERDVPKLYCYPAPGPGPHTAVVVLPGGGYTHVVMEKEGGVEARWLNDHGVSAYVLQYRLNPADRYPTPMIDGLRAVRFVRSHAKAWGLREDPIGIWGFSAGGHLAGSLATADPHGDPRLRGDAPPDKADVPLDDIDRVNAH